MPHLVIECSNKISNLINSNIIFPELHKYIVKNLPTDISTCKSRVIVYDNYYVAENNNNEFINITLKILPGRSSEIKEKIGKYLLGYFKEIANKNIDFNTSVSVEIADLSSFYFK